MSAYPAMSLPPDAALAALLSTLTGEAPLAAVSYGTEAGLYQAAGFDSIIAAQATSVVLTSRTNIFLPANSLLASG